MNLSKFIIHNTREGGSMSQKRSSYLQNVCLEILLTIPYSWFTVVGTIAQVALTVLYRSWSDMQLI